MPPPEALDLSSALSGGSLLEAAAMVLGFIAVLFVMSLVLPGRRVTGPDADGNERVYKLNGLSLYLIVMIAACGAQASGVLSLSVLHTHLLALFVVANGFAFALVRLALPARRTKAPCIAPVMAGFLLRRGRRSGLVGAGSEALQLLPLAHRPRPLQRIVRRRAVRDLRRADPGDDALSGLHLPLRASATSSSSRG